MNDDSLRFLANRIDEMDEALRYATRARARLHARVEAMESELERFWLVMDQLRDQLARALQDANYQQIPDPYTDDGTAYGIDAPERRLGDGVGPEPPTPETTDGDHGDSGQ